MNDTLTKVGDIAAHPREWWETNKACNAGSFGINDIKSAVSLAEDHTRNAMYAGELLKLDPRILDNLKKANEQLKELKNGLGRLDSICKGIAAFSRIKRAIDFLNQPQAIERDPEGSARAFGQLFVGIGHFCQYLTPLKPWQKFFEGAGNFFVNVRRNIDPETKPSHKRLWDEYDKSDGAVFKAH